MRNARSRLRHLQVRSLRTAMLVLMLAASLVTLSIQVPRALGQTSPTFLPLIGAATTPGSVEFDPFIQTELYFGTTMPGGVVSDEQFQGFLNEVITPRFPEGLTLLTGYGQYLNSQGVIARETSKVLILLYPVSVAAEASVKIEEIRAMYELEFQQESVLRVDQPTPVRVSF